MIERAREDGGTMKTEGSRTLRRIEQVMMKLKQIVENRENTWNQGIGDIGKRIA